MCCGEPGDFAFDQDAGLKEFGNGQFVAEKKVKEGIVQVIEGQVGYIGAPGRPLEDFDHPFDFELPDGFADHDAAHLELFRQRSFSRDALSGFEPAGEDSRLELVDDFDRDAVLLYRRECHDQKPPAGHRDTCGANPRR